MVVLFIMNDLPVELIELVGKKLWCAKDVVSLKLLGFDIDVRWCWFNEIRADLVFINTQMCHIELLKWLCVTYRTKNNYVNNIFRLACQYKWIELIKWMLINCEISEERDIYKGLIYININDLDTAKLIHKKNNINIISTDSKNYLFSKVCAHGHIELAMWLKEIFKIKKIKPDIFHSSNYYNKLFLLENVTLNGQLNIFLWLIKTFKEMRDIRYIHAKSLFDKLLRKHDFEMAKYVFDVYHLQGKVNPNDIIKIYQGISSQVT